MQVPALNIPEEIRALVDAGALFIINHSGGKDSQAMYLSLFKIIPREQLIVVHAHLPGVEWEGTIEHIRGTAFLSEIHIVQARKTFFEMVLHRRMFPSPKNRQCTSDLKRGPIEKIVKKIARERGYTSVVNCMGLRAEESSARAKKDVFKFNAGNSCSKLVNRSWYDWLPIHSMKLDEVWQVIRNNNQEPHWAYSKGMSRLSCVFCIMASKADLKTAAQLNPELLNKYNELEREIDHTLIMPNKREGKRFLIDIVK